MATPDLTLSVAEAFEQALRADDEDHRWKLVSHLHVCGGQEALDIAGELHDHADATHRELAADVLGQLGATAADPPSPGRSAVDGPFREDALSLLLAMADGEQDPTVLASIAYGFGHIGDERSLRPLLGLVAHPEAEVRSAVTYGLLGRPEPEALGALITLTDDASPEVRDWATFGLARQTEADFPELRDALADRLADEDDDTRIEAVHGLATRGDRRVFGPLLDLLEQPPESYDLGLAQEALCALAARTGDPRLRPHITDLWNQYQDDPVDDLPENLAEAVARYADAAA